MTLRPLCTGREDCQRQQPEDRTHGCHDARIWRRRFQHEHAATYKDMMGRKVEEQLAQIGSDEAALEGYT